jgi:hypothetical protein
MRLIELQKGITSKLEIGLEDGESGWKALDEQKPMEIPEFGFEIVKENEIMMPRPLKEYLGVECVKNWYQSMTTTLGFMLALDQVLRILGHV